MRRGSEERNEMQFWEESLQRISMEGSQCHELELVLVVDDG